MIQKNKNELKQENDNLIIKQYFKNFECFIFRGIHQIHLLNQLIFSPLLVTDSILFFMYLYIFSND